MIDLVIMPNYYYYLVRRVRVRDLDLIHSFREDPRRSGCTFIPEIKATRSKLDFDGEINVSGRWKSMRDKKFLRFATKVVLRSDSGHSIATRNWL